MRREYIRKKIKLQEEEMQFFFDFLHNENNQILLKRLRKIKTELSAGDNKLNVSFLRVLKANAADGESFSRARLDVEVIKNDSHSEIIGAPIAVFFCQGFRVLDEFLKEEDPKIPEDMLKRCALRNLLQFLTQDHTIITEYRGKGELEWKWALVQHLLILLKPNKTFVMDSYTGRKLQLCVPVEHPMAGEIGDTSFGCPEGWHGEVDIMIQGKEIPLTIFAEGGSETSDLSSISSNSAIEVKRDTQFSSSALQQLMAQTIVFSFLQHNQKGHVSSNCLVPGIGICAEKLIVYMYDCDEDVLIEAMPLNLFSDDGWILHIRAVMILWLILNYGEFGNHIPHKFTRYKSDFHQLLGPFLEVYRNKVTMPCHVNPSEKNDHQINSSGVVVLENVYDFYSECLPESTFISLSKN